MTAPRFARSGSLAGGLAILLLMIAALLASPMAAAPSRDQLEADLDGRPLRLTDVGRHYCHDFAYPRIRCFADPKALEISVASALAASSVDYLTIYDFTTYQGPYMHLSEDYWALSWIGWNDQISSFVVRNGQSGAFWTDWLYSGTKYNFCCNSQVPGLGGYDNAFSSVYRN